MLIYVFGKSSASRGLFKPYPDAQLKKNQKTIFTCQACGYQTPKWLGKCTECGAWESLVEESQQDTSQLVSRFSSTQAKPLPINQVVCDSEERIMTGIAEFDRVLGGGLVKGSLVLIGGDPGIGKSTLMLQALHSFSVKGHRVLYVSGEESVRQLSMRSKRLATLSSNFLVVSEIDIDIILSMLESVKPAVLVIDSIQTMYNSSLSAAPGSVSQVREAALRLMLSAKKTGIPIFLVGHVTKEGSIAGPRLLEHMVDAVLYFEGDRSHLFRILRAVKNRFGSTNEIGVFEMMDKGLEEVNNPSAIFLAERPVNAPGSVVTASMEGTRPILIEIQALASSTGFGTPRRTILGLDSNRVALLIAVIERKLGIHLMSHDIFMNVAGGVRTDEPAADLGIVCAVASSFLDKPIDDRTVVVGEVGLTGEVRAVGQIDSRISEACKLGFTKCLIPYSNLKRTSGVKSKLIGVKSLAEAIETLF